MRNPDSIKARLKQLAASGNKPYDYLLAHYFTERMIYRLSLSSYADNFILKGGLLLYTILGSALCYYHSACYSGFSASLISVTAVRRIVPYRRKSPLLASAIREKANMEVGSRNKLILIKILCSYQGKLLAKPQ
jgi:hypothetical protein